MGSYDKKVVSLNPLWIISGFGSYTICSSERKLVCVTGKLFLKSCDREFLIDFLLLWLATLLVFLFSTLSVLKQEFSSCDNKYSFVKEITNYSNTIHFASLHQECAIILSKISCEVWRFRVILDARMPVKIPPWISESN